MKTLFCVAVRKIGTSVEIKNTNKVSANTTVFIT